MYYSFIKLWQTIGNNLKIGYKIYKLIKSFDLYIFVAFINFNYNICYDYKLWIIILYI